MSLDYVLDMPALFLVLYHPYVLQSPDTSAMSASGGAASVVDDGFPQLVVVYGASAHNCFSTEDEDLSPPCRGGSFYSTSCCLLVV